MNLAESLKYVLKNKSPKIITLIIKEDFKNISFFRNVKKYKARDFSLAKSIFGIKESIQGSILILGVLPKRLKLGLSFFSQDLLSELDKLPDQKKKTIFSLKVLAGISQFALSSAYDLGVGESKLLRIGKSKNLITNIIITKVIFKTMKAFILRLTSEMEKEITDADELQMLHNFVDMVHDDSVNAIDKLFFGITESGDQAFSIVERFKKYILTGQRVTD